MSTTPAPGWTALPAALHGVHEAVVALLSAADEQYAALVEGDLGRLSALVDRQQELADHLALREKDRLACCGGLPLADVLASELADEPVRLAATGVRAVVIDLYQRLARNAGLLARHSALHEQTLQFIRQLATQESASYAPNQGLREVRSLAVDGRA